MRRVAHRLQRLIVTLSYLQGGQAAAYVLRRKLPSRSVPEAVALELARPFRLAAPIPPAASRLRDGSFRFLNVSAPADTPVDWNPDGYSRLWRYNLHYFDYLRQPDLQPEQMTALIDSWIAGNPQGAEPGWEPFTTSLRIVNWIFAACSAPQVRTQKMLASLYLQARWLYRNDERHLLANHYFENLKALAFAGAFFRGAEPRRWLSTACAGLRVQLAEQTLPDGGHFERSPQYHALMLENYLDLINLASSNRQMFDDTFRAQLGDTARRGLDWLDDIVFPDGLIPLFNDSAFGVAPTVAQLGGYARRLFGYRHEVPARRNPELICKRDSGLFGVRTGTDMLIMDCGDVGPAYQPGHTHCDYLSYELMLGGRRVVVDSGVYDYEPGPKRDYVRSTRAHNTLVVDGDEQSELWGAFRVGRRAQKIAGDVARHDDCVVIRGAYRGFFGGTFGLAPKFTIGRTITVELLGPRVATVEVTDRVEGLGEHDLESLVHLHPACRAVSDGAHAVWITRQGGQPVGRLTIAADCAYAIRTASYHPEFGLDLTNPCIVVTKRAALPAEVSYRIRRH